FMARYWRRLSLMAMLLFSRRNLSIAWVSAVIQNCPVVNYTQVYLTDSAQRTLVLHAGTGAVGQQLRLRGFKLPIGPGSINGTAAAEKRAVFVANVAASATFRPNPLLPLTQSEMAVPLLVGERVVGVLDMQSDKPGAFSADNLPAFEALAGQLAIAIENASLFSQTEQARAEMETHARRLTTAGWQNFLNAVERSERIVFTYESPEAEPGQHTESASPAPTDTLDMPIQVAGESVGAIRVESPPDRKWTEEDAALAHTVALRVAQASRKHSPAHPSRKVSR
ncbi:MAG: GAF domain-containing protein, partial [Chloroflexi bacterium]|nr:GAF domain-containing protein [Chloroflexota bacterium]